MSKPHIFDRSRWTGLLAALLAAALVTALPAPGADAETAATSQAPEIDLERATVPDLLALLEEGGLTAVELAERYLERIEQTNARGPALNSVRAINPAWAAEARAADQRRRDGDDAPLLGIPVLIKDNTDVAGMPTTAGSLALADNYPVADAPLVSALKEAGAVILGKTNLTEFSHYLSSGQAGGYSSLGGQVLNAYDITQSPASSSSGSGVAVAAGQTPLATGTETCCSIIGPSTASSVVGVKTTLGLVSRTGIVPISMHMDVSGPMASTVYDAALQLGAMTTGFDPADPATELGAEHVDTDYTAWLSEEALAGARVGIVAGTEPDGEAGELWQAALEALEDQGATLVPLEMETARPTTWPYDFHRDLNHYLEARTAEDYPMKHISDVADYYRANPQATQKYGATNLFGAEAIDLEAQAEQHELDRAQDLAASKDVIDAVMADHDLDTIVFPGRASSIAQMATTAGYPTVAVPAGYEPSNRRPFGIAFTGQAFEEGALLGFAYDYEQATQLWEPPSEMNPAAFRCVGLEGEAAAAASCPPGPAPTEVTDGQVTSSRLAGAQRYETARLIAGDLWETAETVVIAKAETWPDALAGSYLAGRYDSPILLVSGTAVQADTLEALVDLDAASVVLLGGEAAISDGNALTLEDAGYAVTRVAGQTRYETAAEIATAVVAEGGEPLVGEWDGQRTAVVATGAVFADALVSGSAAWAQGYPLLLTPPEGLHAAADAALDELGIERVIVPGGTAAVSADVEAAIEAKGIEVTRVEGGDRWETATAFADFAVGQLGFSADQADIATGLDFADALTMGPHAGSLGAPLLLVNGSQAAPAEATTAWLTATACDSTHLTIAGGTGAVTAASEAALVAAASACEPDAGPGEGAD